LGLFGVAAFSLARGLRIVGQEPSFEAEIRRRCAHLEISAFAGMTGIVCGDFQEARARHANCVSGIGASHLWL